MKELTLFTVQQQPEPLTEIQARALEHVRQAGHEGLRPYQLGKLMGAAELHARSNGTQLLKALKKKRWVAQRRIDGHTVHVALDLPSQDDFGEIPY